MKEIYYAVGGKRALINHGEMAFYKNKKLFIFNNPEECCYFTPSGFILHAV